MQPGRELIERYRVAATPSDAVQQRVKARIASARRRRTLAVWVVPTMIAAGVALVVGVGARLVVERASPEYQQSVHEAADSPHRPMTPLGHRSQGDTAAPQREEPDIGKAVGLGIEVVKRPPVSDARKPSSRSTPIPPRPTPHGASAPNPADTLQAEVTALDAIRRQWERGDAAAARLGLAQYHRRFGTPRLRLEAEALAVLIACTLEPRDEARARAFLANHGENPYASKVEEKCLDGRQVDMNPGKEKHER